MSGPSRASVVAAGTLMLMLVVAGGASVVAQTSKAATTTPEKTWTVPRTADGQPDLQGTWTNSSITLFERPSALEGKEYFTPEEVADVEAQTAKGKLERPWMGKVRFTQAPSDNSGSNDSGSKVVPTRRTAMVIDPPDGRVPLRPEAEQQRNFYRMHASEDTKWMTTWDRCITRGIPGSMGNTLYGNYYQILQVPGYVVIRYEMIHDVRIIPVDGRPHLSPAVSQWMGDSRGHWEGDTLVVETTNFNGKSMVMTHEGGGRLKGVLQSPESKVVERFTRTSPTMIMYRTTIDDPTAYTRPWTYENPLLKSESPDDVILEYACQEGNYELALILGEDEAGKKAEADAAKARQGLLDPQMQQRIPTDVSPAAPSR